MLLAGFQLRTLGIVIECFREPVLLRLPGDSALELNKKLYFTTVVLVVSRFKPC